MNEENRKMLEDAEMDYRGHLDNLDDEQAELAYIVGTYATSEEQAVRMEKDLIQFMINVR